MNTAFHGPDYQAYHEKVIAAIRATMLERWPPRDEKERKMIERNVQFFNRECTFAEAFAEGRDPVEEAENEIEAAIDSQ